MAIYEITQHSIVALAETDFDAEKLSERGHLQRLLREKIDVIASDTLVIAEEFGSWEGSKRRIDLLAIDKQARLVIIELKRTEDGGHMDLQALRYAAMISTMTFEDAVDAYADYLKRHKKETDSAATNILNFLGWADATGGTFGQDVRIVLASADFSQEITSTVLWLVDRGVDIACVRMRPYTLEERVLIDVQQIIPLPEAEEFQVKISRKVQQTNSARASRMDFTRYTVTFCTETHAGLTKRAAIYFLCKKLCDNGVAPDQIAKLFDWRSGSVWIHCDGMLQKEAFLEAVRPKFSLKDPWAERRWFCDDAELLHVDGRTYALSNQWGGPPWKKAMDKLVEAFPRFSIAYQAVA